MAAVQDFHSNVERRQFCIAPAWLLKQEKYVQKEKNYTTDSD